MSRKLVTVISICAALLGLATFIVWTMTRVGLIQVVSHLSSGQADERDSPILPVGYRGVIVPKGARGALSESKLDSKSESPQLLIPGGTPVKIVIAHQDAAQVQILSGQEQGMKPWIHWTDVN